MNKSFSPPANSPDFLDRSALLCAIELEIPLQWVTRPQGYASTRPALVRDRALRGNPMARRKTAALLAAAGEPK
jgi:hypothetical protein